MHSTRIIYLHHYPWAVLYNLQNLSVCHFVSIGMYMTYLMQKQNNAISFCAHNINLYKLQAFFSPVQQATILNFHF